MMICKAALFGHLEFPVAQILKKCRGVSNSTKRHESRLLPILPRQGYVQSWYSQHVFEARGRVENGATSVPTDYRLDRGRRRLHASRDDHNVRATQRRERLAQAARREDHA